MHASEVTHQMRELWKVQTQHPILCHSAQDALYFTSLHTIAQSGQPCRKPRLSGCVARVRSWLAHGPWAKLVITSCICVFAQP